MAEFLCWDAVYEIALALKAGHPDVVLEDVSLDDVFNWTVGLPNFRDDPELANDEVLTAIYQEWYEECNSL